MKLLAAMVALVMMMMLAGIGLAAPLPREMIVKYTTKECSSFFAGDECSDCSPPAGWERLGPGAACPAGFAIVSVEGSCWGLQTGFCCMQRHSGAPGDCTRLVKNDVTKECAFVDNLSCSLPAGWLRRPENASGYEWLCPGDYNWTTVNCTSADGASGNCASSNCTSGNITSGNITSGNATTGNATSGNLTSGNITSGNSKSDSSASDIPVSVSSVSVSSHSSGCGCGG